MAESIVNLEEFLRALVAANNDHRLMALRILRGEQDFEIKRRSAPLLLGMGEAAKLLGVSRSTLWRMIQAGRLEQVELFTGSYRVRREDLERLVDTAGVPPGRSNEEGAMEHRSRRGRPKGSGRKGAGNSAQPGIDGNGV